MKKYVSEFNLSRKNLSAHNSSVEKRAVELGEYITDKKATVRNAAKYFGISKSTVHKDVSERLKYVNPELYLKVKEILEINKAQRHIRGGMATKLKYLKSHEDRKENS